MVFLSDKLANEHPRLACKVNAGMLAAHGQPNSLDLVLSQQMLEENAYDQEEQAWL